MVVAADYLARLIDHPSWPAGIAVSILIIVIGVVVAIVVDRILSW